ncbi:MAG TPA: sigma-54 dependent transcriptional regulator [Candidatus Polarisedimenticolia bacterium]
MTPRATLLIVEDDAEMRGYLQDELREAGYDVIPCAGASEALEELGSGSIDVVVTDLMMPGMKGDELLAEVHARLPEIPVVILTAFGSIDSAVEAIKAGAYNYVAKPFRIEQLLATVESALRERQLRGQIRHLRQTLGDGRNRIIAESPAMRRSLDLLLRAAPAGTPVLLLGESGTGKELFARTLHDESPRHGRPFLAINCSAIPETLLESQLFGHRRGTFTDAREDRRGLFQEADGGSLFLDEIGDMPLALQSKLLRVLQEREVHPLGAPGPVPIDVRPIAATHRDLEAFVAEGRFRQDLYYRLNVITVRIPPLRERIEDLVPLVAYFLEHHGRRLGRTACSLAPESIQALMRHAWPGNVRELENAIERALVLGRDDVLWLEDLPESLRPRPGAAASPQGGPRPLADVEREHILRTLRSARGNKAAAARLLGFDRKTLYRKLKTYGLSLP